MINNERGKCFLVFLSWVDAMESASKELGINRAELVTLIYGNEPFEDLAYVTVRLKSRKLWATEGDRILKDLFGDIELEKYTRSLKGS